MKLTIYAPPILIHHL